ncbi:hypothetical protein [Pelotalea chapellei]|uniref:Uncharacterized protein n=1 Tax=Pelotalea chapellei TaxID=44671 RepID=A0ABS5UCS5_9BACT|nr:hypothetical protein [Pelotalea chapellei]MBT1073475.1 hypothetical protein [Pelotalea chapellei]
MCDPEEPEISALNRVIAHFDEGDELQMKDKAQLVFYRDKILELNKDIAEIMARLELERNKE